MMCRSSPRFWHGHDDPDDAASCNLYRQWHVRTSSRDDHHAATNAHASTMDATAANGAATTNCSNGTSTAACSDASSTSAYARGPATTATAGGCNCVKHYIRKFSREKVCLNHQSGMTFQTRTLEYNVPSLQERVFFEAVSKSSYKKHSRFQNSCLQTPERCHHGHRV